MRGRYGALRAIPGGFLGLVAVAVGPQHPIIALSKHAELVDVWGVSDTETVVAIIRGVYLVVVDHAVTCGPVPDLDAEGISPPEAALSTALNIKA